MNSIFICHGGRKLWVREISGYDVLLPGARSVPSDTQINASTDSGDVIAEVESLLPAEMLAAIHSGDAVVSHDRNSITIDYAPRIMPAVV